MMDLPRILEKRRSVWLTKLVLNGLAQAGAAIATALLVKFIFDHIITTTEPFSSEALAWSAIGLAVVALFIAWLRMMEYTDAERMGQDYVDQVRMQLFDSLKNSAVRTTQKRSRGGVMLRFIGDLTVFRRWVSLGVARLIVGGVSIVGATFALSFVNGILALAAGAMLLAGGMVVLAQGKRMQEVVREARRRRARLAANINEKISALAVIQVFGRAEKERQRVANQSRHLKEAMVDQARVTGWLRGITEAAAALTAGAVLILGALEVATGQVTPGTVVAAMSIVGLLTPPLRDLGRVYEYWQSTIVARQKLLEFINTPAPFQELLCMQDLLPGPGRLEFREVSLEGLHVFSAVAEPRQTIAIVGPNGAGKSTLLLAATRLIQPESGAILLDGQDLAAHSLASVHRAISMASPDLPLMRGTLEDNLRYRWQQATDEEITKVSAFCSLDELIKTLPNGMKTHINDAGVNLSLGQRQRIALARALLGEPAVLLLDEADANLDPQAGAVLRRILEEYRGTILLVTHRLEYAAKADVIWHLQDGRLIDSGPARELLNRDGPTSRLFHDVRSRKAG
ncbi:MAG: ABC transporter ATP-binding protein [Gammaproteobacteria bacterium]|nr:ABC transporter ATP-binding protein [Gammaproteobacteria bacterium]